MLLSQIFGLVYILATNHFNSKNVSAFCFIKSHSRSERTNLKEKIIATLFFAAKLFECNMLLSNMFMNRLENEEYSSFFCLNACSIGENGYVNKRNCRIWCEEHASLIMYCWIVLFAGVIIDPTYLRTTMVF